VKRKNSFLTNIKDIFRNSARHAGMSFRRFKKRGGVAGWLSRFFHSVRKGDLRAIASLCAAVVVVGLGIFGLSRVSPAQTASLAEPTPEPPLTASVFVDLEGDYAEVQSAYEAELAAATPAPILISEGYNGSKIAVIQQRLMDLGYMDNDEPTEHFGPNTETAVQLFQRRHDMPITGVIDQLTYDRIFSADALTYMVSVGVSGTDVKELQGRLRELDYLDKATGYFGEETEAAVKEFQQRNHLSPDGKVGENTREMLYSEDAIPKSLSYGEKSDEVKTYQKRLYKLAYLTSEPDGTFGRDTVNAVKMFQQQNGLIVDGHIGPQTKELMMSSSAKACVISLGDNNSSVTKIQTRLRELDYLDSRATGYFGTSTESAVMGFQKQNRLSADGKVGKATMNLLLSSKAKAAPSDYVEPESSGSSSSSSGSSSGSRSGGSLDRFISAAQSKLGCRYVRGGKGPSTFDCSGFVYWCLREAGVNQKYLTSSGWRSVSGYSKVSSIGSLRRGDIIVFKGHVGIAMGDGTMIDASSGNSKVVHRSCTGDWSVRNFICAWRIF